MDAFEHNPRPTIDVDAEVARILERRRLRLERQDARVEYSYWQIALAGSLTGVGIVAVGTIIGLALIRALY